MKTYIEDDIYKASYLITRTHTGWLSEYFDEAIQNFDFFFFAVLYYTFLNIFDREIDITICMQCIPILISIFML